MQISAFTDEEIDNMSTSDLIIRMDKILLFKHEEAYHNLPPEFYAISQSQINLVSQFMETSSIQLKCEQTKRALAYCAFGYIHQMGLVLTSCGIWNMLPQNNGYNSPMCLMRSYALNQYQIVASRIALEYFIDLIHMTDLGKRMRTDSKFRGFGNWISKNKNNPYIYFIPHIVYALKFSRDYRDDETHGTSRFPRLLLRLERQSSYDLDIPLALLGTLSQLWLPLLDILNGKKPSSIGGFSGYEEFAWKYLDSIGDDKNANDSECFHKYAIEFYWTNFKLINAEKNKGRNS